MSLRALSLGLLSVTMLLPVAQGATVSKQQAESLARKITRIEQHASTSPRVPLRTPMSESEVNSWFTYNAPPLLPAGVAQPKLTIVGKRRVIGAATVDLDAVAKSRRSGRTFDVWNLVSGRVPVTITGLLHAERGKARFEMESAEVSGVPVPRRLVEEMVSYYTRTPNHPNGLSLDDYFALPAGIKQIEISPGNAVVVQ
jgi:hypothetical protein